MEKDETVFLENDNWLVGLPMERRRQILNRINVFTLARGSYVYRLDDAPNGLFLLLDGEVRMISYSNSGLEMVAMVARPGHWFGELSVIDGKPRPHDAIVTVAARLARISNGAVEALTDSDPGLWRDIASIGCQHQRWAMRHSERVRTQTAIVRLAGFLVGKASQSPDGLVRMTQEDLAEIVGVSRQRINMLIRELAQMGLAQQVYGGIIVRNISGMRVFLNSFC